MSTVVFFHAHPDDEAIGTAGTIAAAAAAGHRVVVVWATRGERGLAPDGMAQGAELAGLREAEARRSADLLGVAATHFLGYADSGEASGDGTSPPPEAFAGADPAAAAQRLGEVLLAERAEVLVGYDETGVTGHPDHVAVHRVGLAAARDLLRRGVALEVYLGVLAQSQLDALHSLVALSDSDGRGAPAAPDLHPVPDAAVTTTVQVGSLALKRAAMAAHASQLPPEHPLLAMPEFAFAAVWGREHYVRVNPRGQRLPEPGLLDGLR